jgi:competence protein ComEA
MVNINTITYEQLAVIDGIGEELAANIIEFRNNCGQFENMDQLLNVKGMSYDKRRILKAYVYVELVSSK